MKTHCATLKSDNLEKYIMRFELKEKIEKE